VIVKIKKGDLILIEYTAKVKETGEIFDTSDVSLAKEAGIYKDNIIYEPMLVDVGGGWVLKGLDEKLVGLEVDKKTAIEIPPEGAFGPRDPKRLKLVPLRKFAERKITPYPGLEVDIDGKIAVVRSVGAGRVQVDFNPALAGKSLTYDLVVKQVFEDALEKAKALIHRRIPTVSIDKFNVEFTDTTVKIGMPEEAFDLERVQLAKRGLAADLQKILPEITEIIFTERYVKKKPKEEPVKPEVESGKTAETEKVEEPSDTASASEKLEEEEKP
jgi:peptidylprolyl isomerase